MLRDRRILLGVTGGIAAYKAVHLLREFQKTGAEVRVIMTPAATRFVGLETFQALTGQQAACHIFQEGTGDEEAWVRHVHWAEWADLFVIAPCTANSLSKMAHGLSDNLLISTLLAFDGPVLVCPTMDGNMYDSPPVQRNLEILRNDGYRVLDPEEGYLASGLEGKGRLPELGIILKEAERMLSTRANNGDNTSKLPLKGKKVVVTAGPTREHIDPVRYISNPSSGKMGIAMAQAAQTLGAEVVLIHGPITLSPPHGLQTVPITSAHELYESIREHADADIFILAAAVSDFTPDKTYEQKVKKSEADTTIQLKSTPDSLKWLGDHKKEGQTIIGFAMETENVVENARKKREAKKADWIIANSIAGTDAGFAADHNSITVIGQNRETSLDGSKTDIALQALEFIFA